MKDFLNKLRLIWVTLKIRSIIFQKNQKVIEVIKDNIMKKNKSPYKLSLERFSELGILESKLTDVLNEKTLELKNHILLDKKGFYLFTSK